MKKLISLALALMLLAVLPLSVWAAPQEANGTCGDGLTWTLKDHTLTVSGSGPMDDGCPWEEYKDEIRSVVLTGGVTTVGAKAFYECGKLKDIDFGNSLEEIGPKAFYSCKRIQKIHLPATFRSFESECFRDCVSLTTVYCDGGMPHFRDSCLYNGGYINVYHPVNMPWPSEYVSILMSNFSGRLGVYASDISVLEESVSTASEKEATEAETTEATEEATAAATVAETEPAAVPTAAPTTAPTEAPTVPTTEATVAPTTEEVTEAPTTEEPTEAPTRHTEPPLPPREVGGDGWIGLVIIGSVLTFLLLGILIYRGVSHRGGRYR